MDRKSDSIPKVRASSATMGTMRGPNSRALSRPVSIRRNATVVDISRLSGSAVNAANSSRFGASTFRAVLARAGTKPPSILRSSRRYCISGVSGEGR